MKPKILVLVDWFDPAFKAGGPITSCVNFVNTFDSLFEIRVLTTAYDIDGDEIVGVDKQSGWVHYGNCSKVYYAGRAELSASLIKRIIGITKPDYIYCNSMFSLNFTIIPLWLRLSGQIMSHIVLAPRGMLKSSALQYKKLKKSVFLNVLKLAGIARLIKFQATDLTEYDDISLHFPAAKIVLVGNVPARIPNSTSTKIKKSGELELLFVGRIHPIKQLDFLLEIISSVQGQVKIAIVGPIEDELYWKLCLDLIANLPSDKSVQYLGGRSPIELRGIYQDQHLLVLPTKGENFGHSIFESFANGRPVVISDRTPWRDLALEMTGIDCDLNNKSDFISAIQRFVDMENDEYRIWSANAYIKAKNFVSDSNLINKYLELFSKNESTT